MEELNVGGARHHKPGWIAWIMQNRFVMIILLILFIIIVVPWLVCDVLGLRFICDIISGVFNVIKKIFSFIF